jgi:hypothetical protein
VLLFSLYLGLGVPASEEHLLMLSLAAAVLIPVGAVLGYDLGRALEDRAAPICMAMAALLVVILGGANLVTLAGLEEPVPAPGPVVAQALATGGAGDHCSLGTAEPGRVGSFLACEIADPLGLVTGGASAALARGELDAWIAASQPMYLVSHFPLAPYETGIRDAVLAGSYVVANDVSVPDHRLYRATGADLATLGSLLGQLDAPDETLNEDIYAVGGVARAALFMHVRGRYEVAVTIEAGEAFVGYLGIADGAERSPGVTFRLSLQAGGAEPALLLEQAVVPGAWVPVTVPMPDGVTGPARLVFETDTVPDGTTDYGWAVWGEPRLAVP